MKEETSVKNKIVATYNRVSTEEQREGRTIDGQIMEAEEFIRDNQLSLYKHYNDAGWSGGLKDRPALDEMIEDAGKGLFDAVIINNIDRLARNNAAFYYAADRLHRLGIKILYVKAPNGEGPHMGFYHGIMAQVAELERNMILERTMRGKRLKLVERKEPIGGIPAFGYKYIHKNKHIGESGHYEVCENEAEVVRQIFDWVGNEQLSVKAVQRRLFERHIKTRSGKTKWSCSTLLRILRNEQYIGNLQYNRLKTVETSKHRTEQKYRKRIKTGVIVRPREQWIQITKPELKIIDPSLFRAAQEQILQNKALCKRNAKFEYLLSGGLVKCAHCGYSYVGVPMHGERFYRDDNKQRRSPEPRTCSNKSVPAEKVELSVWRLVVKLIKQPDVLVRQLRRNSQVLCSQEGIREARLAKVVRTIGQLEKEEERVIQGYRKGFLESEQVEKQMQEIKNQRDGLIQEQETLKNEILTLKETESAPETIGQLCKTIGRRLNKMSFEERRRIIRLFIREIRFDGKSLVVKGIIPIGQKLSASNPEFSIRRTVNT